MSDRDENLLSEIRDLVNDAARTLDIEPPLWLFEVGQQDDADRNWYFVGLIGGKEVGKSALVNALVGRKITESTSFGPGTERAIAYVHRDRAASVKTVLEREIPELYEIVQHENESLSRQVLLDLPDIDSCYASHFETVRRLLRFILFPIWIQSLEKYADRQPMDLLRKVVRGNAPENFLYCLNKADQLDRTEGEAALSEIAEDYRSRIGRAVGLDGAAAVFLLSAIHPDRYDLPKLREVLSKQKEDADLAASKALAVRTFGSSLLDWLSGHGLAERVERTERIEELLEALLHARIEAPLFEILLPSIREDEEVGRFLFDATFRARIGKWPIVRTLDSLAAPARRLLNRPSGMGSVEVRSLSREVVDRAEGRIDPPLDRSVAACFAQLFGSFPSVAALYGSNRPWEETSARETVARLTRALAATHAGLLESAVERVRARGNPLGGLFRWMVSLGALVWFPFGQPVVEHFLSEGSFGDLALLLVRLFGVASLLQSALFLALFYGAIWLGVRWRAHRRAAKALESLEGSGNSNLDDILSEWGAGLVAPLLAEKEKVLRLEERRKCLESRLGVDR